MKITMKNIIKLIKQNSFLLICKYIIFFYLISDFSLKLFINLVFIYVIVFNLTFIKNILTYRLKN